MAVPTYVATLPVSNTLGNNAYRETRACMLPDGGAIAALSYDGFSVSTDGGNSWSTVPMNEHYDYGTVGVTADQSGFWCVTSATDSNIGQLFVRRWKRGLGFSNQVTLTDLSGTGGVTQVLLHGDYMHWWYAVGGSAHGRLFKLTGFNPIQVSYVTDLSPNLAPHYVFGVGVAFGLSAGNLVTQLFNNSAFNENIGPDTYNSTYYEVAFDGKNYYGIVWTSSTTLQVHRRNNNILGSAQAWLFIHTITVPSSAYKFDEPFNSMIRASEETGEIFYVYRSPGVHSNGDLYVIELKSKSIYKIFDNVNNVPITNFSIAPDAYCTLSWEEGPSSGKFKRIWRLADHKNRGSIEGINAHQRRRNAHRAGIWTK